MNKSMTYTSLNVHKDTNAKRLPRGKCGEIHEYGKIANSLAALKALAMKVARNL